MLMSKKKQNLKQIEKSLNKSNKNESEDQKLERFKEQFMPT